MKKRTLAFFAICLVLCACEQKVTHGPGIQAKEAPIQERTPNAASFEFKGFTVSPLAEFSIRARVLSREDYSKGRESELSPIDLALGWGYMSDERVLDDLKIWQSNRWYRYKWKEYPPIPLDDIIRSSSNMHIIPANEQIAQQLQQVKQGHIVTFRGKLVRVTAEDNWFWVSSLSREDSGNHACEVVYVEEFDIVEGGDVSQSGF